MKARGNNLEIGSIKIRRIDGDRHLKAMVSMVLDGAFAVHDMKIIAGQDRLFLAMPSKRLADGGFRDIVHPIDPNTRGMLERLVLDEYSRTDAQGDDDRF